MLSFYLRVICFLYLRLPSVFTPGNNNFLKSELSRDNFIMLSVLSNTLNQFGPFTELNKLLHYIADLLP